MPKTFLHKSNDNKMKNMLFLSFSLLLLLPATTLLGQVNPDAIVGIYYAPEGDGKIEIYQRKGKYYGKVTCCDVIKTDHRNPDPEMQNRKIMGLEFMYDFEWDGSGTYRNGNLYNPEDGRTYSCMMWLEKGGEILKIRGYWGISAFGKTVAFRRV